MKIIDLLNKIANGDIPKRIIYDKYTYEWNNKIRNYERRIDKGITLSWDYIAIECLNDEVEILEEEKKIPEKLNDTELYLTENQQHLIVNKINEIIDFLDYLKSKGE